LVEFDHENKKAYLSMRAEEILHELNKEEEEFLKKQAKGENPKPLESIWRPEYGRFMIEGTPGEPYTVDVKGILKVESNMRNRRKLVQSQLQNDEEILSISNFPILGAYEHFTTPEMKTMGPIANSAYISDDLINTHIRFG
jgi:glutamate--cysteine ligase catalytic subunit